MPPKNPEQREAGPETMKSYDELGPELQKYADQFLSALRSMHSRIDEFDKEGWLTEEGKASSLDKIQALQEKIDAARNEEGESLKIYIASRVEAAAEHWQGSAEELDATAQIVGRYDDLVERVRWSSMQLPDGDPLQVRVRNAASIGLRRLSETILVNLDERDLSVTQALLQKGVTFWEEKLESIKTRQDPEVIQIKANALARQRQDLLSRHRYEKDVQLPVLLDTLQKELVFLEGRPAYKRQYESVTREIARVERQIEQDRLRQQYVPKLKQLFADRYPQLLDDESTYRIRAVEEGTPMDLPKGEQFEGGHAITVENYASGKKDIWGKHTIITNADGSIYVEQHGATTRLLQHPNFTKQQLQERESRQQEVREQMRTDLITSFRDRLAAQHEGETSVVEQGYGEQTLLRVRVSNKLVLVTLGFESGEGVVQPGEVYTNYLKNPGIAVSMDPQYAERNATLVDQLLQKVAADSSFERDAYVDAQETVSVAVGESTLSTYLQQHLGEQFFENIRVHPDGRVVVESWSQGNRYMYRKKTAEIQALVEEGIASGEIQWATAFTDGTPPRVELRRAIHAYFAPKEAYQHGDGLTKFIEVTYGVGSSGRSTGDFEFLMDAEVAQLAKQVSRKGYHLWHSGGVYWTMRASPYAITQDTPKDFPSIQSKSQSKEDLRNKFKAMLRGILES